MVSSAFAPVLFRVCLKQISCDHPKETSCAFPGNSSLQAGFAANKYFGRLDFMKKMEKNPRRKEFEKQQGKITMIPCSLSPSRLSHSHLSSLFSLSLSLFLSLSLSLSLLLFLYLYSLFQYFSSAFSFWKEFKEASGEDERLLG